MKDTLAQGPITIEEFERLPDDGSRTELVRGRLVREPPPGFEHGGVAGTIHFELRRYAEAHGLGRTCVETGFILSADPPTVRAPDVAFVAARRIPPGRLTGFFPGAPDLAVEVVSPTSRAGEVQEKVLEYLDAGTRLVWVVYPGTRTVVAHRSRGEARIVGEGEELDGADVVPGLRVPVARIFEA